MLIEGTTTIVCGLWLSSSIDAHSGTSRRWSSSKRSCANGGDAGTASWISITVPQNGSSLAVTSPAAIASSNRA